jgi:hypothetical protein
MSSTAPPFSLSRYLKTTLLLTAAAAGLFVALLVLAVALLVLRLMMGPMTVTSLTPLLENVLQLPGMETRIAQSRLDWDREKKRAVLWMMDVQMAAADGARSVVIPQATLILRPMGYFDDDRSPWSIIVKKPVLNIRFNSAADTAKAEAKAADPPTPAGEKLEEIQERISRLLQARSARSGGLRLISHMTMEEGSATLTDEAANVTWTVEAPVFAMKREGNDYSGKASLKITRGEAASVLDFAIHTSEADNELTASLSFDHLNPSLYSGTATQLKMLEVLAAPLTGSITLRFDSALNIREAGLNVNLHEGEIRVPEFYQSPLAFNSGQVVARYDDIKKLLTVEPLQIDFANATLKAKAAVDTGAEPKGAEATVSLYGVPVDKLPDYWPESAGKNARDWILTNIKGGYISEATVNLGLAIPQNKLADAEVKRLDGGVKVGDAQLTYWQPLPPLEKVFAEATFTAKGFDIDVKSGEQGGIKLQPSKVVITGLDEVDQIMTLEAHLDGPAPEILAVLDRDPLGYAKKINIKPNETAGKVTGVLNMSFPLLKALLFDQIELNARADIKDASLKKVADLADVTDGNMALQVSKDELGFEGQAKMNGVPASVKWREVFAPKEGELYSDATIRANGTPDDLKKFGLDADINGSGKLPAEITYQRGAAQSKLGVKADLKDAAFEVQDLGYAKPLGMAAALETVLEWGAEKPMRLSTLNLTGSNVTVKGEAAFDKQQRLSTLKLDPVRMGETRVKVDYQRDKDGVPHATVRGAALDFSKMLGGNGKPKERKKADEPTPLEVDLQVERLITGREAELTDVSVKGTRDKFGWAAMDVRAMAQETPVTVKLGPQDGRTVLKVETKNLGHVLRALDITDTLTGGDLLIDGQSEPGDYTRTMFGHLSMKDYRVANMPVLASLISAISPDGLAMLLSGNGLGFSELTGEYVFSAGSVVITKAQTSAGSLGLTAAGKIDTQNSTIELEGQVIPVYFISKIVGSIPVIGDILSGGEGGGIFAATYSIKGPLDKPGVSVNPVSVLAPGILRNILFMDPNISRPPVVEDDEEEEELPAEKAN